MNALKLLPDCREESEVLFPVRVVDQQRDLVVVLLLFVEADVDIDLDLVQEVDEHNQFDVSVSWGQFERRGFYSVPDHQLNHVVNFDALECVISIVFLCILYKVKGVVSN